MAGHQAGWHEPTPGETEDEAAARYESDKDSGEWGEPVRQPPRRRLATVVSVRFSPEELDAVKTAAGPGGVSRFIREAAVRAAQGLAREGASQVAGSTYSYNSASGSLFVGVDNAPSSVPATGQLQLTP